MPKKQSKKARPDPSKEDNEFFIPADDEDWNQQAALFKLQFTGLADLPQDCLASGSETTDGQFMTYRGHKVPLDNATVFESRRKKYGISDDIWEKADRIAGNSDELDAFIGLLKKGILSEHIKEKDRSWPGSFFSLKRLQEQIIANSPEFHESTHNHDDLKITAAGFLSSLGKEDVAMEEQQMTPELCGPRTPSPAYEPSQVATSEALFPKSDDESLPNTWIIQFLDQSTRLLGCYLAAWTMDKVGFQIVKSGDKRYTAYTDGALRPRLGDGVQAVVEVKKEIRTGIEPEVTKQEFSEVVGMIKDKHPPICNEYWPLVALDRHEVYLEFFHCVPFDVAGYAGYIKCLENPIKASNRKGKKAESYKPRLECHQYGPWDISNYKEMAKLMRIFIAITLMANLQVARELVKED